MIEVTAAVGLDAIGNDCEQQVSRQMSGRGLLEYALPSRPKSVEVEPAQVRDLVLNGSFGRGTTIATFSSIASCRQLHATGGRALSFLDAIYPAFVVLFGNKIETELFANDSSKEAAHRMLLPIRGGHEGSNCCACRRSKHRNNAGVLGGGPRCCLLR